MEHPEYCIFLKKEGTGYSMMCQSAKIDGVEKYLHNEIACDFEIRDGRLHLISGWHIGTEDFEFSEEDCCDWVLEMYHPGITEQLIGRIDSGAFDRE